MAVENLTTYTESDPNTHLAVTSTRADSGDTGGYVKGNEDVWLYKDFGAGHFDALDVLFEVMGESAGTAATQHDYGGGAFFSDVMGELGDMEATSIGTEMFHRNTCQWELYLLRGNFVASDYYIATADTLYYCTLTRAAGNDGATLEIYSDAARTNLLDTLSVSGYGTDKWRYCYAFQNYNQGEAARIWNGYYQNMDLQEVASTGSATGLMTTRSKHW